MTAPAPSALQRAVHTGITRGWLPHGTSVPTDEGRPWPVVLLTALGAWLAAVPLLGVVGLLLGDLISQSIGPYLVGALMLAAAITVLRSRDLPVFVEQLALPALLVGGGALAFGLMRDLPDRLGAGVLMVVALGVAIAIERPWLRALLGVSAAGFAMFVLMPGRAVFDSAGATMRVWLALHGTLALWGVAGLVQQRVLQGGVQARLAAAMESIGAGWLLAVLAALSVWSGMTFLMAGNMGMWGGMATEMGPRGLGLNRMLMQACSVALGGVAVLVAGRRWPALRQPAAALVGVVLAALCWFLPALGAVLLALVLTATSQRWALACAAAVAAAWIIGGFYYQLQWPLAHKALVLTVAGTVLAGLAWWSRAKPTGVLAPAPATAQRSAAALMVLAALLTLGVANFAIWQKETLIAQGEKVFVALAPVDPRSLMQGDFMRLNYNVPDAREDAIRRGLTAQRPHVIARRDARGVAQLLRLAEPGAPLATGEMRIELTPKDGRWILVSDAWFFREGDGQRWEAAKFGEFRVAPDGRALLVGLADAQLKPIAVQP